MSHLRLPEPAVQVPVIISLRKRGTSYSLRALGSLYVASYDSQSYRGGILTRLHTGNLFQILTSQRRNYVATDSQSVSQSVFASETHLGHMTRFLLVSVFLLWRALREERTDLSRPCQSWLRFSLFLTALLVNSRKVP
jgi:hypothetical protein